VKRSFWLKGRFKLINGLTVDDYLIVTIMFYLKKELKCISEIGTNKKQNKPKEKRHFLK